MNNKYLIIDKKLFARQKKAKITIGEKWYNSTTKRTKTLKHIVYIEPCQDSYEQYGATPDVLYFTLPIANKLVKTNFKSL